MILNLSPNRNQTTKYKQNDCGAQHTVIVICKACITPIGIAWCEHIVCIASWIVDSKSSRVQISNWNSCCMIVTTTLFNDKLKIVVLKTTWKLIRLSEMDCVYRLYTIECECVFACFCTMRQKGSCKEKSIRSSHVCLCGATFC